MKARKRAPAEEERQLDQLVPHPLQPDFFDDLSDHDLAALAHDIKKNGLREKIQVLPRNKAGLPANTILDGHQRRKALLLNGVTTTAVVVRYDLAEADAAEVECLFLGFNQNRRQLDTLAKAQVALRLYEIERGKERGELQSYHYPQARDRVGKAIGMCGRNLNRYFRVLRTPTEVQDAFRRGEISLVVAGKVCDVDAFSQFELARRIRDGEPAKAVVGEYVGSRNGKHVKVGDALASFARDLRRGLNDLDGRVATMSPNLAGRHREVLEEAKAVIAQLLRRGSA